MTGTILTLGLVALGIAVDQYRHGYYAGAAICVALAAPAIAIPTAILLK